MDAFELFNERGEPCGVWCCGKCRKLTMEDWRPSSGPPKSTREAAEKCCQPWICETCGAPGSMYHVDECDDCRSKRWAVERAEGLQKKLETAEDVTDGYEGPVCLESYSGGDMGDGYFSSAEVALEYLSDDDDFQADGEVWAFACVADIRGIDIERALEQVCEDGYEDMGSDLRVSKELREAVDKFNKENERSLTCWDVDYRRKVRLAYHGANVE
jgi:hypothetical protein